MSEKAKGVLARLEEELGGVVQVKNFIVKELKALEEELEELVGDDNTLTATAGLTGHGAGEAPGNVSSASAQEPSAPVLTDAGSLTSGTSSQNTTTAVNDSGEASTAAGADTAAAVSGSGNATVAAAASAEPGEDVGNGNTAQNTTSAPLPDAPAPVSDGAKVAE